jgi:hypothetical protein
VDGFRDAIDLFRFDVRRHRCFGDPAHGFSQKRKRIPAIDPSRFSIFPGFLSAFHVAGG